jgi:hypothetical protein
LGEEYAALLVEPSYSPPQSTELLLAAGGAVVADAVVKGKLPILLFRLRCSISAATIGVFA